MSITFYCSNCDQRMRAPEAAAGRKGRCKGCGGVERVPYTPSIEQAGPARQHHYAFAHALLPELAFRRPGAMLAMTQGSEGRELLHKLWKSAGYDLPASEQVSPKGLKGRWVEFGPGFALAMIRMPRACRAIEALQVVGVHYLDERGAQCFRLMTLELIRPVEGGAGTVLCEWTVNAFGEFDHINHLYSVPDSDTALAHFLSQAFRYDRARGCCLGEGIPMLGPAFLLTELRAS